MTNSATTTTKQRVLYKKSKSVHSKIKVHFQETLICSSSSSAITTIDSPIDDMQHIDRNTLWYTSNEMKALKDGHRKGCQYLRLLRRKNDEQRLNRIQHIADPNENIQVVHKQKQQQQEKQQPSFSYNGHTRGLEYFVCTERKRRQLVTKKLIIHVSKKIQHVSDYALKLAKLAQRCNEWATQLALEEGRRDYHNAYNTL